MTSLAPLEAKLVDFALNTRFEDLPSEAIRAARMRVLDSIGVAMAAYLAPPARIARRLCQPTAGPLAARVWGTAICTTLEMAAFANGVMVRYLDLNDAWRTKDAHHPSDYLPGILAVAEAKHRSGRDFVAALAVAYEIMCRFTDAVPFNTAGWDQPLTGALGTSLAAGRLLDLDREAMSHALSLALIPNLCTYQTRAGELSMWKGCAGPNGARNGVFAALLAAEGMTGPVDPFDGAFGIWNQALQGQRHDLTLPDGRPEWRWGIAQTNIKSYPVRDSCQLPIMTALDLRQQISAGDIAALKIVTYKSAWEGAVKDKELWRPRTRETADHSMLFSVACALLDGTVTPDSFESGRFLDPDVLDLIGRTDVEISEAFNRAVPSVRNCRITATDRSGAVVEAHRVVTLADIERGMSDQDLETKFTRCVAKVFDERHATAIRNMVGSLESLEDVGELTNRLAL